jgi:FkbH-like protein
MTTSSGELKSLLLNDSADFWDRLTIYSRNASDFDELFLLSSLRKKAHARKLPRPDVTHEKIRLALLGGYSLYPFHDLLEHLCDVEGLSCELWLGDFDNYHAEIIEESGALYEFQPDIVLLMPPDHRCRYTGKPFDPGKIQREQADRTVGELLDLTEKIHRGTRAEIMVSNFVLPARYDLGPYRSRTLGSEWSFRKLVNLELGLKAPSYVHILDLEFLAHRHGGLIARDERAWFESKQPGSANFLAVVAHEATHFIASRRRAPRKVLVLDLDNTLWGGVLAEDGPEGIEIGDTSPRGEAFKAFQKCIASLKERGILLAVCSKNDHATVVKTFEEHPEMVLRMDDFVSFKANWEPKSENLHLIADELNLGLDSFVFVDDNPAEIEIVRQFAPGVATILLGPDPSDYVAQLQDCRMFEPRTITAEDVDRTKQYQGEAQRKDLLSSVTDMDSYLESLKMEAIISEFTTADAPRIAQLINKTNQFNLTTRRRTEGEVHALMRDESYVCFSVRLKDRFGDHGLISVFIAQQNASTLRIDTWLMSCRVLKRQVEDEVLNELARLAGSRSCVGLEALYLPTPKNKMVRDFYLQMGFNIAREDEQVREFELAVSNLQPRLTKIKVTRRAYEPIRSDS